MLIKSFLLVNISVILLIYFSKNTNTNLLVFFPFIIFILLIIFVGLCACSVLLALIILGFFCKSMVEVAWHFTAPILVTKYGLLGSIVSTLIAQFGSLIILLL